MAAIELAVGIIVATYLTLVTLVLTYFGFADLGADAREAEYEAGRVAEDVEPVAVAD